jgi:hypothetical protein
MRDMLDEDAANPRMQRRGAPHNLIELIVRERQRRLIW